MQHKVAELGNALATLSKAGEPVDLAYALMCETMDVIGLAGFNKDYNNVNSFSKGRPAEVLDVRTFSVYLAHLCVQREVQSYSGNDWIRPKCATRACC